MKIVVNVLLLLISYGQFNGAALFDSLLNILKEKFMVSFFDSKDIMTIMLFKILNVRRIGTQGVLVDNNLQMGMILAEFF